MLSENPSIVVFGDSHIGAIKQAAKARPEIYAVGTTGKLLLSSFSAVDEDGLRVFFPALDTHKAYEVRLRTDTAYVFSGPFHTSRLARNQMWLKHCPWKLWQSGSPLLPVADSEIAGLSDEYFQSMLEFLRVVKSHNIKLAVMESPRLLLRVRQLWKGDPSIVEAVDALVRDRVRHHMDHLGVPVLSTPETTYEGGWTKAEFAAQSENDVHHGNREYGALMLKKIDIWAASFAQHP